MRALAHEKVVYIIGAGFSAQFGLPVMSNFIEKSKDMFAIKGKMGSEISSIDFFDDIYYEIDELRRCKDYYAADMTNIEEILSLFEMDSMLRGRKETQNNFQQFIAKVIQYYTPPELKISTMDGFSLLEDFIKKLFCIEKELEYSFSYDLNLPSYSVLTFNYDMLWENVLKCIEKKDNCYEKLKFSETNIFGQGCLPYIKLHGSADLPSSIVTPTWRKMFEGNEKWHAAGEILSQANHIRIIGYSLPITDSYLKYFLKWGAVNELNLKSIDVICLDDEQHATEKRYHDFIHNKLNFYNNSTLEYLNEVNDGIEDAHENLFGEHTKKTATLGTGYFPRSF